MDGASQAFCRKVRPCSGRSLQVSELAGAYRIGFEAETCELGMLGVQMLSRVKWLPGWRAYFDR